MTANLYLTRIGAIALTVLALTACSDDDAPSAPRRVLTSVSVSFASASIELGEMTRATAVGLDQDGAPLDVGTVNWASDEPTIAAVNPTTGFVIALSPGTTRITATIDGKLGAQTIRVSKAPGIRINEVQPRGDTLPGWIEFFNPTASAIDMAGWSLVDANFFGPTFSFPANSVIPPNGFLVVEESVLPFIIDATDSSLLFSRFGVLVDQVLWLDRPDATFGRCPNGSGSLELTTAPTKGTANACP